MTDIIALAACIILAVASFGNGFFIFGYLFVFLVGYYLPPIFLRLRNEGGE